MNATRTFKQRLIELGILAAILVVLVAVVVVSGIMPVSASGGHWAITDATLQFASKRSIQTNSLGIQVPPLDEPEMIRLGAATYESNCAWCHGSPLQLHPVVPAAMTPSPPSLIDPGDKWESRELFYIAKHGIMFTGMPAWPTQTRDDEIWPMVAFLQALGSMDAEQYAALLYSKAAPETIARGDQPSRGDQSTPSWMTSCVDCHGRDGRSVAGPRVPELQQLSREYIAMTLQAMREGKRPSGIMQPIVSRLSAQQVTEIAEYFGARQTERTSELVGDDTPSDQQTREAEVDENGNSVATADETFAAGLELIQHGSARRKIAACIECHGRHRSIASYPSLIGQSATYMRTQLELYADGSRQGGEASLMHDIADKLDEKERIQVSVAFSRFNETLNKEQ